MSKNIPKNEEVTTGDLNKIINNDLMHDLRGILGEEKVNGVINTLDSSAVAPEYDNLDELLIATLEKNLLPELQDAIKDVHILDKIKTLEVHPYNSENKSPREKFEPTDIPIKANDFLELKQIVDTETPPQVSINIDSKSTNLDFSPLIDRNLNPILGSYNKIGVQRKRMKKVYYLVGIMTLFFVVAVFKWPLVDNLSAVSPIIPIVEDNNSLDQVELQPTSIPQDDSPVVVLPELEEIESDAIPVVAEEEPIVTLLFTGIIAPSRCVQAEIDNRDDPYYLYANVRDLISTADYAVGTLNATMSDYTPRTGCSVTYLLLGGPENADALAWAGFDMMSVATNHIKNCGWTNCGDRAFDDTLENLDRVGITTVGAGDNLSQALRPKVVEINGIRFGFVSLGQIEPLVFAGEDTPGIAVLNEENLRNSIAAAKKVADVVVVLPHWGPEDSQYPNPSQAELAEIAVEAGADLVVGNHTHVIQASQKIDDVLVFYGLGNFVFDQYISEQHKQSIILTVTFKGTQVIDFKTIPVVVALDGTVSLPGPKVALDILNWFQSASERIEFLMQRNN